MQHYNLSRSVLVSMSNVWLSPTSGVSDELSIRNTYAKHSSVKPSGSWRKYIEGFQSSGSLLFSAHHRPACSASTPVRATLQTRWDDASSSVDLFKGSGISVTSSGMVIMKFALRSGKGDCELRRQTYTRVRETLRPGTHSGERYACTRPTLMHTGLQRRVSARQTSK